MKQEFQIGDKVYILIHNNNIEKQTITALELNEDIIIFTKGKARKLRIDVKKTNKTGIKQYMSGTNKILPTAFDVRLVSRNNKIL